MGSNLALVAHDYSPIARKKIQIELASDISAMGGANRFAEHLEHLFMVHHLDHTATSEITGEDLPLEPCSKQTLRKFFKYSETQMAKVKPEVWRYLDVLRKLYRRQLDDFSSSAILAEFGLSQANPTEDCPEALIPSGKHVLIPKDPSGASRPALLEVGQVVHGTVGAKLWVCMNEEIDPLALRDFVRFGHPPQASFEYWSGRGYQVQTSMPLKASVSFPPPYVAIVMRHQRTLAPSALIATTKQASQGVSSTIIHTALSSLAFDLHPAEVGVDE